MWQDENKKQKDALGVRANSSDRGRWNNLQIEIAWEDLNSSRRDPVAGWKKDGPPWHQG